MKTEPLPETNPGGLAVPQRSPITRRKFLRGMLATGVAAGGAYLYAGNIERFHVEERVVRLSLGLQTPLRVVALGDLHFDPLFEEEYLAGVLDRIHGLKPDLIVYTGDFMSRKMARIHDLARLLSRAQARLGAFAVLGNHDHWLGPAATTRALAKQSIRVLRNESVPIPGQENFFLTGLESFWGGRPNTGILSKAPSDARHLLLVHEPDSFAKVTDPRIKLQVSGHTHGGQVRIPFLGALHLPAWGKLYSAGLFAASGRHLYVNRGVGTIGPHVRFCCRPEITVFELT